MEDYRPYRHSQRQAAPSPLGFWSICGAVLVALLVHSLIVGVIVELRVRAYIAELDAEIAKLGASFEPADVIDPPRTPQSSTQPAGRRSSPTVAGPVSALPGTIRAREIGSDRACINGRIYRRLSNGWDHIGGHCRATSQ